MAQFPIDQHLLLLNYQLAFEGNGVGSYEMTMDECDDTPCSNVLNRCSLANSLGLDCPVIACGHLKE